jgi:hypothetical protein
MQDPIILPAILTENLVLETLNEYYITNGT